VPPLKQWRQKILSSCILLFELSRSCPNDCHTKLFASSFSLIFNPHNLYNKQNTQCTQLKLNDTILGCSQKPSITSLIHRIHRKIKVITKELPPTGRPLHEGGFVPHLIQCGICRYQHWYQGASRSVQPSGHNARALPTTTRLPTNNQPTNYNIDRNMCTCILRMQRAHKKAVLDHLLCTTYSVAVRRREMLYHTSRTIG